MTQIKFKLFAHGSIRPLRTLLIFLMLCVSSLSACQQPKGTTMDNQPVILQFGQQDLSNSKKDSHPVELTFIERKWRPPNLGKAHFKHGRYSFDIDSVFYILTGVEERYKNDGIQDYSINFGISDPDYIKHHEAYERAIGLIKQLQQKGWQRYLKLNDPRLAGKDAYKYAYEWGSLYDPRLNLTYEQWRGVFQKNSTFDIQLYADGVILELTVRSTIINQERMNERRPDLDFKEWGGYLYRMEIRTIKDDIRQRVQAFDDDERAKNWLVNWAIEKEKLLQIRKETEQKLRQEGYNIDETYQDPVISMDLLQ